MLSTQSADYHNEQGSTSFVEVENNNLRRSPSYRVDGFWHCRDLLGWSIPGGSAVADEVARWKPVAQERPETVWSPHPSVLVGPERGLPIVREIHQEVSLCKNSGTGRLKAGLGGDGQQNKAARPKMGTQQYQSAAARHVEHVCQRGLSRVVSVRGDGPAQR